jgi:branched-chain amino acid transport system ATP-binding protein
MLELINGYFRADGVEILKGVNFQVERGRISLLFGPNGSGKSTVFKALIGIIKAGRVVLDGEDISILPPHRRFEKGVVLSPERMRIARNLTVEENLLISCDDVDIVYEKFPVLRRLRREKAKNLSGGERQLVVFGRAIGAITGGRRYLLLDEPFQGVHPTHSDTMLKVFEELKEDGKGIAIISHERVEDLLKVSDSMDIMLAGRIVHHSEIEDHTKSIRKLEEFMLI